MSVLRAIPPSKRHALELDSLRAIAIFSVLFHHYLPANSVLNRMQLDMQEGPAFGVPLFFALSGFLITRILVQSRATVDAGLTTSRHSLYVFYVRRILRIFPIYYATLFIGVVLKYKNVHNALPWHFTYLSNIYYLRLGHFDKGPAPVFWTLSVEEQFYLIWPLMFLSLPTRRLPIFTFAAVIVGALFSGWASDRGDMINLLLPAHLIYLALGSYLGLCEVAPLGSPQLQRRAMRYYLLSIPVFVAGWLALRYAFPSIRVLLEVSNGCRYLSTAVLFAWIVARLSRGVSGPVGAILRWKPLTYIGRISYGMYILQFFVTQRADRFVPKVAAHIGQAPAAWLLQSFPARVAMIIAAASVSWFVLEKPLNDLKRFFPYRRPSPHH